jgi:hypothetical protein
MKKSFMTLFLNGFLCIFASYSQAADSGFLADYSKLSEVKDANGETVMRYVNPQLKPGAYQSVMIDPTQFYPAPKASEQVSLGALNDISAYMDKGLRNKISAKLTVVSQPGPGVLRIRPAITAVAAKNAGLKPYQVIPIAFVVASAVGRDKEATIEIEIDVVDSMSGERMAAAVRKGIGAKLPNKDAMLVAKDVQPLLDKWIDTGSSFVAEQVK